MNQMAYNQQIADRVRERFIHSSNMVEKEMMGGLAFMVNDKMCVGVVKDELMCRIDPDLFEEVLEKPGCRPMDFTGKPMRGWVFVSQETISKNKELDYWIALALAYNSKAKKAKKKPARKGS
jgi:TfoX/Sxy family transcriptional regulator of competence genes